MVTITNLLPHLGTSYGEYLTDKEVQENSGGNLLNQVHLDYSVYNTNIIQISYLKCIETILYI